MFGLLATLQNTQEIEGIGDISDKISEGIDTFFPRAENGRDYNKSLLFKLKRLETDLFKLVTNQQDVTNHRLC
ncbi:MAG: hypothetical protein H0T84_02415 [Tatlockia sp.]|nr:hypothetical protein [Tatlockia sp.]